MVLSHELSITQAARRAGVSGQAVSNWRRQFVESGIRGLDGADRQGNERERQLCAQIVELKKALGEIYIQLRAQRSPDGRRFPVANSRGVYVSTVNSPVRRPAASSLNGKGR